MTDQWAIILAWFANYSNFYSVMSVLVCFCAMVVFILRLNGEHLMGSTATHYNVVKEQKMVSLHNPFSIRLNETKSSSLTAGIHLNVSVTKASLVSIFWGVNIQAFRKELNCKTTDIASNYREKKLFDNKYLHMTDLQCIQTKGGVSEMSVKCPPTVTEAELGEPSRQMYPVVMVSILQDSVVAHDENTIVIQLTVFHMKDTICTLDSHIVYQFVKTCNNQVLSLQPIFMVTSDPDITSTSSQNNDRTHSDTTPPTTDTTEPTSCETCGQSDSATKMNTTDSATPGEVDSGESSNTVESTTSQCNSQHQTFRNGGSTEQHACSSQRMSDETKRELNVDSGSLGLNEEMEATTSADINTENEANLDDSYSCIVCQSAAIYYTLLPCRHACVCGSCIRQLDRCPMCRGYIIAYFRLYNVNVTNDFDSSYTDAGDEGPRLSRWEALNQRLNEFLGFS